MVHDGPQRECDEVQPARDQEELPRLCVEDVYRAAHQHQLEERRQGRALRRGVETESTIILRYQKNMTGVIYVCSAS